MSEKNCGHSSTKYTSVCSHVYANKVTDEGVMRFSGKGIEAEYLCETCATQDVYDEVQVCESCLAELKEEPCWTVQGAPGILHDPQEFVFSRRSIFLDIFSDVKILAVAIQLNRLSDMLFLTSKGDLYSVDIKQASSRHIMKIESDVINGQGIVTLNVSRDNCFASLTSVSNHHEHGDFNSGVVVDLNTAGVVMKLKNGDYYTQHTTFPVTFIEHKNKTLVVHSTDWNRLDVTDPLSGKNLTQRDYDNFPEKEKDDCTVFTEWNGELLVSPDQRRIATIGWIWHPVGTAYSWDAQVWLDENVWEYDSGKSKVRYAYWDYFWDSPFLWLNNDQLCIWGYDELHTDADIPLPSVAIYDARTTKLISWFAGPTMDVFYYDQYLFSGSESGDAVTIWSVEDGTLLHEEKGINAMAYHPQTKEFMTIKEAGEIEFIHWQKSD